MRQMNFPHILPLYTAFVNNLDVYVVSPIMCYNSCRDAMNNYFTTGTYFRPPPSFKICLKCDTVTVTRTHKCQFNNFNSFAGVFSGFPELLVSLILRDVLLGLDYLNKKGFIHRSIRASHILLSQTKAVLCGFRESTSMMNSGQRLRLLHELPPSTKSLNWLAPEVLEQNLSGYTEKSDVYSVGITTCELANGLEPFSNMPTTFMLTEKIRGNQPALLDCSTCPDDVIGKSFLLRRKVTFTCLMLIDFLPSPLFVRRPTRQLV